MNKLRVISILIVVSFLLGLVPITVGAADAPWPTDYSMGGREMPFKPADQITVYQNPPDFSWPNIPTATKYELKIARDKDMKDVAYENNDIKINFYNFPNVFEINTYYWSVRSIGSMGYSEWSQPRRFRIDPNAWGFPFPSIEDQIKNMEPTHPRVWTNKSDLESFRKSTTTGFSKASFEQINGRVRLQMTKALPEEPTYMAPSGPVTPEVYTKLNQMTTSTTAITRGMLEAATLYLITGDKEVGEFAKKMLIFQSEWDINGATSYKNQDQLFREIAYKGAMAYDWLYDVLSPDERAKILDMIAARTKVLAADLLEANAINKSPYNSHGWTALGYIGIIAIATYGEIPESEGWLKMVVPTYSNILPPWSAEDGGWSQGTDYFQYGSLSQLEFADVLKSAKMVNLFDKAWMHNQANFDMYMHPKGSIGAFGDDAYLAPSNYSVDILSRLASVYKNPQYQWAWQTLQLPGGSYPNYIYWKDDSVASEPPLVYQRAHYFKDIGQVTMHSDLVSPERISMFFKSSRYGSYNHSHPDQNSFVIQAYGQPLAIDSGYYDYYMSDFDVGYTLKTYAHNAITIDNGKGQPKDDFQAKGEIKGFVNHNDFDCVTGDASTSYKGVIGQAIRHIVYIRPDMFIVIDDLAAKAGESSNFEWWLNAQEDISVYQSGTGAKIVKGVAALDAKIHYPKNVTANYSNVFAGPDGKALRTQSRFLNSPIQKRVWFQTPKVENTTMVTTLDVHNTEDGARYVKSKNNDDNIELFFEDGSKAIVRTKGEKPVTVGKYTFDGAAIVIKGDSTLLVSGTSLAIGGKTIVQADVTSTVALGAEEIDISTTQDGNVKIYYPNVNRLRDIENRTMPKDDERYGITWKTDNEFVDFKALKGEYKFYVNDRFMAGEKIKTSINLTVENETKDIEAEGILDVAGAVTTVKGIGNSAGVYKLNDISSNASLQGTTKPGTVVYFSEDASLNFTGQDAKVSLLPISGDAVGVDVVQDYDALKGKLNIFKESEKFDSYTGVIPTVYTTRQFLSNGTGISNMGLPGQSQTWKLDVLEEGDYDIVVKYVTGWDGYTSAKRAFILGDSMGICVLPGTVSYGATPEEWRAAKIRSKVHLAKGQVDFTFMTIESTWNIDWSGLVKSE